VETHPDCADALAVIAELEAQLEPLYPEALFDAQGVALFAKNRV
jgi:hypothetical protein